MNTTTNTNTWALRLRANKMTYLVTGNTIEEALLAHVENSAASVEWMRGQYRIERTTARRFEVHATHPVTGDTWLHQTWTIAN